MNIEASWCLKSKILAGRGGHGTGKEYENCVVEYVRSTEELYVRWNDVNRVYCVFCDDRVHGAIYIHEKPFGPKWQ